MLTPKEAYFRFKADHPDLEPKECGFYKKRLYVFSAPRVKDGVDYNSPFYAYDAITGRSDDFNPMEDLMAFQDAFVNHPVDWR